MFKAVLFDWDGTLADTRAVIIKSFREVLTEIRSGVSDEFVDKRIGIGDRNTFRDALKYRGIPYDDATLDKLVRRKNAIQLTMTDEVTLQPGAVDLLKSLKGKVKLAVATMSTRNVIDRLLEEKGLRGCFDLGLSADDVQRPKPDPEVFLKCASKLGVQPMECVVVEDSVFGVRAAKDAGMGCVAVATGTYSADELRVEGADLVVPSLNDREAILNFVLG